MQRATTILGALALVTATAMPATAGGSITGTVVSVHPASNIVKFNDGRSVYVNPGAVFTVDGRQVTMDQIRPGMRVAVDDASQSTQVAAATAATAHPPVDVSGTIARYDHQTQLLHFQDGRMVKLGPESSVWQPSEHANLSPGARVFVRQVQPLGYTTAWNATTIPRHRMGTVVRVDPARALVILSDGTTVRVLPATRVLMEGQAMTLSHVRPGDEVVIIGTSGDGAGMALPRAAAESGAVRGSLEPYDTATFDATDIHLMRRPQSP